VGQWRIRRRSHSWAARSRVERRGRPRKGVVQPRTQPSCTSQVRLGLCKVACRRLRTRAPERDRRPPGVGVRLPPCSFVHQPAHAYRRLGVVKRAVVSDIESNAVAHAGHGTAHRTLRAGVSSNDGQSRRAASSTAGTPAVPNVDGSGSVGEVSVQACEERQFWRGRLDPHPRSVSRHTTSGRRLS
jgi:hypothetical protein